MSGGGGGGGPQMGSSMLPLDKIVSDIVAMGFSHGQVGDAFPALAALCLSLVNVGDTGSVLQGIWEYGGRTVELLCRVLVCRGACMVCLYWSHCSKIATVATLV